MNLRDELLSEPLRRNLVTIREKKFTILEMDDAETARLAAACRKSNGKWIEDDMFDGKLLSRCVRDEQEN